jgi:glycosyltransferase involved in cell wall biosynthesis
MLRDTLEALKNQVLSAGMEMEILVVDNNSKDKTREVVSEASLGSPYPVRYVFEAKQGLCFARNHGIAESRGNFLIFTGDDVIPSSQWADALYRSAERNRVDLIGGPILPIWAKEPPAWLSEPEFQKHLALLNYGNSTILREHIDPSFLFGTNMAFRKKIFSELGGFETEDAEMIHRVLVAGKIAAYEPKAVVYHRIPRKRMHVSYLRKNLFSAGKAYIKYSKKWDRIPRWLVRECMTYGSMALWFYITRAISRAVNAETHFWYQLGMIKQLAGFRP